MEGKKVRGRRQGTQSARSRLSGGGGRKTRLEERGKGDGVASKQHRRRARGSVSREIGERTGEAREERRDGRRQASVISRRAEGAREQRADIDRGLRLRGKRRAIAGTLRGRERERGKSEGERATGRQREEERSPFVPRRSVDRRVDEARGARQRRGSPPGEDFRYLGRLDWHRDTVIPTPALSTSGSDSHARDLGKKRWWRRRRARLGCAGNRHRFTGRGNRRGQTGAERGAG